VKHAESDKYQDHKELKGNFTKGIVQIRSIWRRGGGILQCDAWWLKTRLTWHLHFRIA